MVQLDRAAQVGEEVVGGEIVPKLRVGRGQRVGSVQAHTITARSVQRVGRQTIARPSCPYEFFVPGHHATPDHAGLNVL